ncbi:MAG: glycosyltransferase family 39 protein [Patescibacteria group bacterium]
MYRKKIRDLLPILFLILLSLFKFYRLPGGINLGEPDEFIHAEVANNFRLGFWPRFSGGYWFFELPLFPYLGYLVSLIYPGNYVGLRIVSVIFSIVLALGIYFYLKFKVSARAGLYGSLIFIFSPMAVYYSRLGLLDMGTAACAMLFLFSLDYALSRRSLSFSILSGIFLGGALLIKYSALIYLVVLGLYWLVRNFKFFKEKLSRSGYFELDTVTTIPLIITFLLTVPLAFFLRRLDPFQFKLQLFTSLGFVRDFWRLKGGELTLAHYGGDIVWWLGWPVMLLALFSLVYLFKEWRRFLVIILGLLLTALFVLPHTPFYPRYFFPLIPFAAVLAGLGSEWLLIKLKLSRVGSLLLFVALLLSLVPSVYEAWASTQHRLIENTGAYIDGLSQSRNPWIFTSYWPNYFGVAANSTRATWLTSSAWDAGAYVKDISASPLELLGKAGGFVVLENLYSPSPIFIHNPERISAWKLIREQYSPAKIIEDKYPNFPHFSNKKNSAEIYYFPGE